MMSYVKLVGVDDNTAATLMAIVSHRCGIDLKHLDFKAIRLMTPPTETAGVKEEDVYTLMSLVSSRSGIPLEYLNFKSIRNIDKED